MPTLFLRCRSCSEEFPTPIAVTEAGLGGVMITGMPHRCPACGEENDYSTHDYYIPKEAETTAAEGATASIGGDNAYNEETRRNAEADRLLGLGVDKEHSHAVSPTPTASPNEEDPGIAGGS